MSGLPILLVDNTDEFREALGDLLTGSGFEVAHASTVEQAEHLLGKQHFAAVLTDYLMGDVNDGWSSPLRVLRAARPTPVGLITGWKVDLREAKSHGFAFALSKPFEVEKLLQLLTENLPTPVQDAERQATVLAYFDALSNRNWDGLVALCADDVRYHVPGSNEQFSRTIRGRAAFRNFSEETFAQFPDAKFKVTGTFDLPQAMLVRWTSSWAALDERPEMTGALFFTFDQGAIAEIGIRMDVDKLSSVAL